MQVSGLLIGVRSYDFTDKNSGEQITGAKVSLGVSDSNSSNVVGYVVSELPADFAAYPSLSSSAKSLIGKNVTVDCEVTLRGKATRLKAKTITAA